MTDAPDQSAAEMRSLLGFARGLGLDEATVREIYETVGQEAAAASASDDERMAEVRKRMLANTMRWRKQV
jgi:hypothetical protein